MRSALSTLEVLRPRRLDEALGMMAAANGDRPIPIAGGTDLFVYLNAGTQRDGRYLDLLALDELRGVAVARGGVTFGALTTFGAIRAHPAIRRRLPSLAQAASEIGARQIQNRATLAGNIANASPAGDSLPVLLAHDAEVEVRSRRGARWIAFAALYTGYRALAIEPDELITAVFVPSPPPAATPFFRKVGTRRAQSISKVVCCGLYRAPARGREGVARLAYGSVAPVPVRARAAEEILVAATPSRATADRACEALARDIAPIDDIRSDRDYRSTVARRLLAQFLRAADARFTRT